MREVQGVDQGKDGWMDGVTRPLQGRGMDVREARERARDRNNWRGMVRQF